MQYHIIKVLMLKHLMVRIRRIFHTAVDFIFPLILFIIVFIIRKKVGGAHDLLSLRLPPVEQSIEPLSDWHPPDRVMFYPKTNFTETLMKSVGEKLSLQKREPCSELFSAFGGSGICSMSNQSKIEPYYANMQRDLEAVVLFNHAGSTLPKNLKYTIRIKTDFKTDKIQSYHEQVISNTNFGREHYGKFMRLQWAIDTSFMKLNNKDYVDKELFVQEFPNISLNSAEANILQMFCEYLQYATSLSLIITFVFLVNRLLEERLTGIQELIKMVGVSVSSLGVSHFLNVALVGLLWAAGGAVLFSVGQPAVLPQSNGFLMFIFLLIFFVSVVAMAFAASAVQNSARFATTAAVLIYVLLLMPSSYLQSLSVARWLGALCGLVPHVPVHWFWMEVAELERHAEGLTFSSMWSAHTPNSCSVALAMLMLLVQTAGWLLLYWYLSLVNPGPFGHKQPWNFMFQKQYWSNTVVSPANLDEDAELIDTEAEKQHKDKFFEKEPESLEIGIKINNVTKVYPKQTALKNVSLNVYKGEITVLLGHNGAGKTTLMSIITGMTSATHGDVSVNGMDTVKRQRDVRKHLGLCPQHNLFFPDLTALEHLMFFYMLHGYSYGASRTPSRKLLERLNLADKAGSRAGALSGGMQRRLQLACALAGDADVLILDEPTSGLDVETRRELWDLLLSIRENRTVLLTTHFMEEADALGDRVAALHQGTLRCFASTMHLKMEVGTGYRVSLTTSGPPQEAEISRVVRAHAASAQLKAHSMNNVTYLVESSDVFPQLFAALEEGRARLAIAAIAVGVASLEEVFLRLCSDTDVTFREDEVDGGAPEPTYIKYTGAALYVRQLWALLKRQAMFVWSKKYYFLVLQFLIPLAMVFMFTYVCNTPPQPSDPQRRDLDLEAYSSLPARLVLYHVTDPRVGVAWLRAKHPSVTFVETANITSALFRAYDINPLEYSKYLLGIEISEHSATIHYTTVYRHAAPIALNLVSSLLSRLYGGGELAVANHQVELFTRDQLARVPESAAKSSVLAILWAVLVAYIIQTTVSSSVGLAIKERVSGARHIHVMCGCPPALHWLATLLFHVALHGASLVLPAVLIGVAFDTDNTFNNVHFFLAVFPLALLGLAAVLALVYVVSFGFGERGATALLGVFFTAFGVVTPVLQHTAVVDGKPLYPWLSALLVLCSWLLPPHAMSLGMLRAAVAAVAAASPHDPADADTSDCYYCMDVIGQPLVALFLQLVVYMAAVVLTQYGFFNGACERVLNARYRAAAERAPDEAVRAEALYAEKAVELTQTGAGTDQLVASDLHKSYFRVFGKSCNAVRGLSFSVKKGECFGLLGVNGAGKSTTFKLLTAEETPTRGHVYSSGYHFKQYRNQYLQTLGYCPQFSGIDGFQTGRANIELVLTLRGLARPDVVAEAERWIQIVGLSKYASRVASGYSGGCTRRLAAGAALSSGARLTLLDEPTAGVDVAARRRVWAALRRGLRGQRAVVITSHSMDEMEALCGRIGIMYGGMLRALGDVSELRARHAPGHAVRVKVRPQPHDEVDSASQGSRLDRLKKSLREKFDCVLKEEHQTVLLYHVKEPMRYSELFSALEELKVAHSDLLEDYSVSETTLEEVFLSFAKDQGAMAGETGV